MENNQLIDLVIWAYKKGYETAMLLLQNTEEFILTKDMEIEIQNKIRELNKQRKK